MKRAFTLVEIIVAIVIVSLISGGALLYMNEFNSRQKLEAAREEVATSVKLVQSYAKTRQLPLGSSQSELRYVTLSLFGTNKEFLNAHANTDASRPYFRNLVNNDEISVSLSPEPIIFWAGTGRLAKNTSGEVYGADETAVVIVESNSVTKKYRIIIDAMGQIREVEHEE